MASWLSQRISAMSGEKERGGLHTEKTQRQLFQIQDLTRDLIRAANESERLGADGETTTPQDLLAVRKLSLAQKTLLESMQVAIAAGLKKDAICTQGIDRTVAQSIVVSDLAHYLVGEIKSHA